MEFPFCSLLSTRNLTFYASHTVKIKWLIYNLSNNRQCKGVVFVNYTSLNFRKSKQLSQKREKEAQQNQKTAK